LESHLASPPPAVTSADANLVLSSVAGSVVFDLTGHVSVLSPQYFAISGWKTGYKNRYQNQMRAGNTMQDMQTISFGEDGEDDAENSVNWPTQSINHNHNSLLRS